MTTELTADVKRAWSPERIDGLLASPPLILRGSRLKEGASHLLLPLLFVVSWVSRGMHAPATPGTWLLGVGLLLWIALGVMLTIWPPVMTIDVRGIEIDTRWRRRTVTWGEAGPFFTGSYRSSRWVAFNFAGEHPGFGRSVLRFLGGSDSRLPMMWELDPTRLAELLNRARSKWGGGSFQG